MNGNELDPPGAAVPFGNSEYVAIAVLLQHIATACSLMANLKFGPDPY